MSGLNRLRRRWIKPKIYAGLGDLDKTFELLERAVVEREPWIMGVKIDPGFAPIRQDARYQQFLRRLNR